MKTYIDYVPSVKQVLSQQSFPYNKINRLTVAMVLRYYNRAFRAIATKVIFIYYFPFYHLSPNYKRFINSTLIMINKLNRFNV